MGKKHKGNSVWEPKHPNITIFDRNSVVNGNIYSSENIRINCEVMGDCLTEGTIVVSESGKIRGKVSGQSILIKGCVIGDVHSKGQIVLGEKAHVEGDCICQSIVVDAGAFLRGRVAKSEKKMITHSKTNPEIELSHSVVTETNDVRLEKENNVVEDDENPNRLW